MTLSMIHPSGNIANAKQEPEKKEEKKPPPEEKPKAPVIEGPDAKNALGISAPTRYVHQWIPMPKLFVTDIKTLEPVVKTPSNGNMMVVFFLASWCEPCQNLSSKMVSLTQSLSRLPIDFYFVFAHDTIDDAKGFMAEHHMSQGYLAELDTLKNYNNPELPTIYISDRDGWLLTRYLKFTEQNLDEVKGILRLLTTF